MVYVMYGYVADKQLHFRFRYDIYAYSKVLSSDKITAYYL